MTSHDSEDLEPVYALADAVKLFLPGGRWTVNSLRTEIRKGRLVPERIAGKLGVTRSAIMEMRRKCREEKHGGQGSCSGGARAEKQSGSSSDAALRLAQDATRRMLKELKGSSRKPSPPVTSRPKRGASLRLLTS